LNGNILYFAEQFTSSSFYSQKKPNFPKSGKFPKTFQ